MSVASKKYSSALMDIALENNIIDRIFEDFNALIQLFEKEKDFWNTMTHPGIKTNEKIEILRNLLSKNVEQYLLNFLFLLLEKDRFNEIDSIFNNFKKLYLEHKNTLEVEVVSAVKLNKDSLQKLEKKLEKKFNKTIILINRMDKSILGGLIIYIGDQVIDGSIRSQLSTMRSQLKEIRLQELGVN